MAHIKTKKLNQTQYNLYMQVFISKDLYTGDQL